MKSFSEKTRASALLLSFFMMTLLILVAITVSSFVIRDVRTVRTIVGGVQSWYAAEGMSELGLQALKENLPGYEPSFSDASAYTLASNVSGSLGVHGREFQVPCEDQSLNGWRALGPNESVQLPLFAQVDDTGNTEEILEFYVEFYLADSEGNVPAVLPSTDILRWKILGLKNGSTETEAISEYIPLDLNNGRTSQENPSMFGSAIGDAVDTRYSYAKYYSSGHPSVFYPTYPIGDFLEGHDYNYLVITNIVQEGSADTLFLRLNTLDVEAICEYSQLSSAGDASFAEAHQELKTLVKEGENLPVFDFVLYHTSGEQEEQKITLIEFSWADLFGNLSP